LPQESDIPGILQLLDEAIDSNAAAQEDVVSSDATALMAFEGNFDGIDSDWKTWDESKLLQHLGIGANRHIPGFRKTFDKYGVTTFTKTDVATTEVTYEELHPLWHQLVGILRMLELAFDGKPVLLMDEVGVGKTLQATGFACMLHYYRAYYEREGKYPNQCCSL
jgi:hypothetical protein